MSKGLEIEEKLETPNNNNFVVVNINEIIKKISSDKRLIPDLLKAENGNNFRAVSESAILDVVDPVLKEAGIFYTVEIKEQHLEVKEAFGSKGRKLQFIAWLTLRLRFFEANDDPFYDQQCLFMTEAVGMGIDDNDKAMGKAYTYAVKYALLKLFRLRYGDDPDFEASKALYLEKPKEEKKEEVKPENEDKNKKSAKKMQKGEKSSGETPMTEKQRDYILGLMTKHGVKDSEMINIYGYSPETSQFIPMPKAREMIKWLEEGALPF